MGTLATSEMCDWGWNEAMTNEKSWEWSFRMYDDSQCIQREPFDLQESDTTVQRTEEGEQKSSAKCMIDDEDKTEMLQIKEVQEDRPVKRVKRLPKQQY